jgi:Putative DNA-binding domain
MKFESIYSKIRNHFNLHIVAIIILIYLFVGVAQYYFVRYQLFQNIEGQLKTGANQISNEIVDRNGWQIEGWRRSMINVPNWHIIDTSGVVVDINELLPNLIEKIEPIEEQYFNQPQTIITKLNEHYRVFAKHLDSAYVMLSIEQPNSLKNEDSILSSNAALFGSTLKQALSVTTKDVDNCIDNMAIVSSNHNLLRVWGGVPLKITHVPKEYFSSHFQIINTPSGVEYLYFKPVSIKNNTTIGTIIVYKNISDTIAALHNELLFNLLIVAIALVLTLLIFAAKGLLKTKPPFYTIEQAIAIGENEFIEFKETYNYHVKLDIDNQEIDLRLEVVEAIAGFSNANGGQVFIGISDNNSVIGIGQDLHHYGSPDKLEQDIVNRVSEYLGREVIAGCKISFPEYNSKIVCVITVPKSKAPVYFRLPKGHQKEKFVLRIQHTTRSLPIKEVVAYW